MYIYLFVLCRMRTIHRFVRMLRFGSGSWEYKQDWPQLDRSVWKPALPIWTREGQEKDTDLLEKTGRHSSINPGIQRFNVSRMRVVKKWSKINISSNVLVPLLHSSSSLRKAEKYVTFDYSYHVTWSRRAINGYFNLRKKILKIHCKKGIFKT